MGRHPLLVSLIVVLGCIASGSLECSHTTLTQTQQRGGELYARMCAVCHGTAGQGYKADQATALAHPAFLASASDVFLRSAIADGRTGTTMSAWSKERGGPLAHTDVDAVIAFMRSWERRSRAVLDERPLAGDGSRGAAIYGRECARCHGPRGTGGPYLGIGNPQLLGTAGNGFLRYAVGDGRLGTVMPSFEDSLGDQGVDDVVALLRSWESVAARQPVAPPARSPPIPLGPVPLNPKGPEPAGFRPYPETTSADQIKAQLDRHARMALLDARAPSDYTGEHIAGAVSVPFYDPDPYFDALPKNAWLVCYCACPRAESGTLAQKLQAKGFTKVTVLAEGIGFWRSKQYGTHTGVDP
jgi:cytochrome c oxidase cbb3-type subunit 3